MCQPDLSAGQLTEQDNLEIRSGQPGAGKGRSCLTDLLSSCDKVTCFGAEDRLDVTCWDLSKASGTAPPSLLLDKLAALHSCSVPWLGQVEIRVDVAPGDMGQGWPWHCWGMVGLSGWEGFSNPTIL